MGMYTHAENCDLEVLDWSAFIAWLDEPVPKYVVEQLESKSDVDLFESLKSELSELVYTDPHQHVDWYAFFEGKIADYMYEGYIAFWVDLAFFIEGEVDLIGETSMYRLSFDKSICDIYKLVIVLGDSVTVSYCADDATRLMREL